MKHLLAIILFAASCSPVFAVETFEQAWQSRWRPQVAGSFMSRRFEPQIKAACKEVWDTAQRNIPTAAAKPKERPPEAVQPAKPAASAFSALGQRRRGFFRRRRGLFR